MHKILFNFHWRKDENFRNEFSPKHNSLLAENGKLPEAPRKLVDSGLVMDCSLVIHAPGPTDEF